MGENCAKLPEKFTSGAISFRKWLKQLIDFELFSDCGTRNKTSYGCSHSQRDFQRLLAQSRFKFKLKSNEASQVLAFIIYVRFTFRCSLLCASM